MNNFSTHSLEELSTCHNKLVRIAFKAIEVVDFSIIEGGRSLVRQEKLFEEEKTQTMDSYHLITDERPYSLAFDILPYPFNYKTDWHNRERFALLAGVLIGVAHEQGTKITWGGDWHKSWDPTTTIFYDAMHFQVEE